MTRWSVRDGPKRKIEFDGERLGKASSRRLDAPRWTEIRLYRSESGIFVLEKVGRSVVLHAPDCDELAADANLPRFQVMHPGEDPANGDFWFCETCGRKQPPTLQRS